MTDDELADRQAIPLAARVVSALPRRARPRATIASVVGALVSAVVAAELAPAYAAAVEKVLRGELSDGLVLLATPIVTVAIVVLGRRSR